MSSERNILRALTRIQRLAFNIPHVVLILGLPTLTSVLELITLTRLSNPMI